VACVHCRPRIGSIWRAGERLHCAPTGSLAAPAASLMLAPLGRLTPGDGEAPTYFMSVAATVVAEGERGPLPETTDIGGGIAVIERTASGVPVTVTASLKGERQA